MTAKLMTGCSVGGPPVGKNVILNEPDPTLVTNNSSRSVPDFWLSTTVSVAATAELVTVKGAGVAEPAAETSVMAPVGALQMTVAVRLAVGVMAPPAPVA